MKEVKGFVNSIQTLGTVDGPGVRFVVFMQGCTLRCGCCHNPETWEMSIGDEYTPEELIKKVIRYKSYFGADGGVTLSGGEPLLQTEFAKEFFILCHSNGINTCLDTSGSIISSSLDGLLNYTDRVLLDIKYTNDEMYEKYAGCSYRVPLEFLKILNEKEIKTTVRQVIIPTLNDTDENAEKLAEIIKTHNCVDSFELLPFKKLCIPKYDNLGMEFRFKDIPTPEKKDIEKLTEKIKKLGV